MKTKQKPKPEYLIGQQVVQGLTQDQLAELIDMLFYMIGENKIDLLLASLDEDIALTLLDLLSPSAETEPPSPRIASDAKHIDEWDKLWGEWHDIAFEVGDEEGKYVTQDHHWEEPYFCPDDVTADLEAVAGQMFPLVERLFPVLKEDRNPFSDLIREIDQNVKDYPEWMGAEENDGVFESFTTRCVLMWEWLSVSAQNQNAATFAKKMFELEDALTAFSFHNEAVIDFFNGLPENSQRQIYQDMRDHRDEPPWEYALRFPNNKWYKIYHSYSRSFDFDQYLKNCEHSLHENWTFGLPLIGHLIDNQDYVGAEKIIRQCFASYFGTRETQPWLPEASLLINRYYHAINDETKQLLAHWLAVAGHLHQEEREAAIKIQIVTCDNGNDWDTVIKIFREIANPAFLNMRTRLFEQWQLFITHRSISSGFYSETPKDNWIHWLLETGLDDAKNSDWFASQVNNWLQSVLANPTQFENQIEFIYTLSNDLAQNSNLGAQYPKLFDLIVNPHCRVNETDQSRCAWLERMGGQQFIPLLMDCWKRNVAILVPEPSNAHKSQYDHHANWLAVVRELNPRSYQKIIGQWKVDHARRKNLWAALKRLNLPF